jgi:hypothetical protein
LPLQTKSAAPTFSEAVSNNHASFFIVYHLEVMLHEWR